MEDEIQIADGVAPEQYLSIPVNKSQLHVEEILQSPKSTQPMNFRFNGDPPQVLAVDTGSVGQRGCSSSGPSKPPGWFLVLQETRMTWVELFQMRSVWGNGNFGGNFIGLGSYGESVFCTENLVVLKGTWVAKNLKCCIFNIYSHQGRQQKRELWGIIRHLIIRCEEKCLIFYDSNAGTRISERRGTVFCPLTASDFNYFIYEVGLVDIPMGEDVLGEWIVRIIAHFCYKKLRLTMSNFFQAFSILHGGPGFDEVLKFLKPHICEWKNSNRAQNVVGRKVAVDRLGIIDQMVVDGEGSAAIMAERRDLLQRVVDFDRLTNRHHAKGES
ncbi:hypothetical protein LXL04_019715 [Taraxacum kok-saghyz]